MASDQLLPAGLAALTRDRSVTAILLDVDGTLAPIVPRADTAQVPQPTRALLADLATRFGLVACVTGRPALVAREIVGLADLHYIGGHGSESLAPQSATAVVDPSVAAWRDRVHAFVGVHTKRSTPVGLRREDKNAIVALHWRGVEDEAVARAAAEEIAASALDAGLATHWGRRVLEIRPPVSFDKGRGIDGFLDAHPAIRWALSAGDDRTDLDAFTALRARITAGKLDGAICVAVNSAEAPAALLEAADLTVESPDALAALLEGLR